MDEVVAHVIARAAIAQGATQHARQAIDQVLGLWLVFVGSLAICDQPAIMEGAVPRPYHRHTMRLQPAHRAPCEYIAWVKEMRHIRTQ